jgi:hypothetical protein
MKWYFASRMRHKEAIDKIVNFLKTKNHEVAYEWSKLGSLKPYNENPDKSSSVANDISLSLKDVDIFVLITDEAGTDMFIELGIVIGRWLDNNKTKIYAVGKFNDRSLMHFHPAIKRVDKLSDIFSKECPELLTQGDAALLTSFDSHITGI